MRDLIISVSRDKKKISDFDPKVVKKIEKKEKCDFCDTDIRNDLNLHTDENNLYASCSLCYYSEHLDKIVAMDKGRMILMPEINQQTLNNIIRFIWFLESNEDERFYEKVETIIGLFEKIQDREQFAESYYTEGAQDVDIIINALHNFGLEKYRQRSIGFNSILWLPSKDFFKDKIKEWNASFEGKYSFENFEKIIEEAKERVNG